MAVWYGTPQFLRRDTVRFFVMVRVWYVGTVHLFRNGTGTVRCTWFELKILDFSHNAPAIGMQRQKITKAEVKCVN